MTNVIAQRPVGAKKVAAKVDAATAKGAALADVCLAYATKRMEDEEKQSGKLGMILKSISELDHKGHIEFRAKLTSELNMLQELRKTVGVTKEQTKGYAFNSFSVLVTNWKTISTACELGLKVADKSWGQALAEAVAMKHSHAAAPGEGAQLPTKRKAGRKATPLIDKAQTAAQKLLDENPEQFKQFAAWVEKQLKTLTVH